jgi:hypothetical protein
MALSIGNINTGVNDGATSVTISHTVASNNHRVLIVGVHSRDANAVKRTVSGITYNSVALTLLNTSELPNDRVELWYLQNPDVGTFNVVVTMGGAPQNLSAGTIDIYNAMVQLPEADTANTAAANTITTTVATISGYAWVFSLVISDKNTPAITHGGTQTNLWNVAMGNSYGAASYRVETVKNASASMQESQTGSGKMAQIVAAFTARHLVNVNDAITITENVHVFDLLGVPNGIGGVLSDTATVTEHTQAFDYFNLYTVSESISLNELLAINLTVLNISVFDSISESDFSNQFVDPLVPNVFDAISIFEFAFCYDTELFVGPVADTIPITENIQAYLDFLFADVYDIITITEFTSDYLSILHLPVAIDSAAMVERLSINLTVLNISVYDSATVSENLELYLDVLNIDIYDSASITDFSDQYFDVLNISDYDSITVSEYDYVIPTRGALPANTQVCSGHDGTRNWRCWFDKINNRIVFEYATDPDGAWTEDVGARITKAGLHNDFSLFSNPTEAVVTYSAGGILYVRKSTGYPATNFSWDTEYAILVDSTKTYKNARLKKNSDNYYMGVATEVNGSDEYIVAFKSTNTNDVSAWDAEVILGTTSDTNKNFGAFTSTYNGQMAVYTDSGNLYYKLYDGANWDVSGTLLCATKSGYNSDDWDQFDIFYNPSTQKTHIIYVKSDGSVVERDYDSGGLGSENILESGVILYDPNVGFFYGAAYVCYTWAKSTDGITSQIDCVLENGGMGEIFELVEISNIAVASDYIKTLTEAGAFITWEEPDGSVHSKSAGLGLARYDDATISEFTNISLDVLNVSINDSVSIVEFTDISLDVLNISIYDGISITENFDYITDVQNTSVYDTITITEDLVPLLVSLVDVFDGITITEDYASYLDQLFTDVFDSLSISEDINLFPDPLYISLEDSISILETLLLNLDVLSIELFDTISISEFISILLPALNIGIFDDVSIFESISIIDLVVEVGPVSDDVAITELLELYPYPLYVDLQDSILVIEFMDTAFDPIHFDVGDNITISESLNKFLDELFTGVHDVILVQEYLNMLDIIVELGPVWEDIVVSEDIAYMMAWYLGVADDILIDEAISESFYIWKALMTLKLNSEISEEFQTREEVWQP